MNTNIKLSTAVLSGMLLLSACESKNSTTSAHDDTDSADMAHDPAESMSQGTAMDTTMPAGHGLMTTMSTMMDKMSGHQMTGDFDLDFANMMIEHHRGAIEMSNIELTKGTDAKMKSMAQNIIAKQNEEIKMLQKAIANHKSSGMKHAEGYMQKSMTEMNVRMGSMQMSNNTDKDFATMMIVHHEEAIKMAKVEVKNAMNPALKKMAQKTITAQTKEIGEFKNWLASN